MSSSGKEKKIYKVKDTRDTMTKCNTVSQSRRPPAPTDKGQRKLEGENLEKFNQNLQFSFW